MFVELLHEVLVHLRTVMVAWLAFCAFVFACVIYFLVQIVKRPISIAIAIAIIFCLVVGTVLLIVAIYYPATVIPSILAYWGAWKMMKSGGKKEQKEGAK